VTHAQPWASYSALYRLGRLSPQRVQPSNLPSLNTALAVGSWEWGRKSSESVQCAMLKAC